MESWSTESLSMRINNILILLFTFFAASISHAKVRDLYINSNEMGHINLKMGQSTVLRFLEKPKKVVIGNQNYFNVEFIDNDVTIQPLGTAKTNLFVYGEYNTYGLILSVDSDAHYDDLVIVKRGWRPSPIIPKHESRPKQKNTFSFKKAIGDKLLVTSDKIQFHDSLKLYILDLRVEHLKKEIINVNDLKFMHSQGNKTYGENKVIIDQKEGNHKATVRLLIKLPSKRSFTLNIKYQGLEAKQIVEEKYL